NLFMKMSDQALLDEYKGHIETPTQLLSLADFTNLKPISQDGFGRSYSATFLQTGQEIILKRINFLNEAVEQVINREIEIHQSMQFRFITRFIDQFHEGENSQYFVMEYYKGGDLYNYIKTLKNKREIADENLDFFTVKELFIEI
ncbi:MAG: hypothetical protein EZS28_041460, partial [Streblomastix strix]